MEVREAGPQDIPHIVGLLRISLGESLMPKSEHYWQWKHLDNPFGRSPVLLCFDNDMLVGVRAFMRWEWRNSKNHIFKAVRAVDTATHPQYQGKGIFRKLTMELVKTCTEKGDDFVFNTPNAKSRPGYLKMGWIDAGRLPVTFDVQRPFSIIYNVLAKPGSSGEGDMTSDVRSLLHHSSLDELIACHCKQSRNLITNLSPGYLRWRYLDVPVASYIAVAIMEGDQLTGLMIGRQKRSKIGSELRITELLIRSKADGRKLMKSIKAYCNHWHTDYTTLSGTVGSNARSVLSHLRLTASIGPMVTVRQLAATDLSMLKMFNEWSPSLGDLELF